MSIYQVRRQLLSVSEEYYKKVLRTASANLIGYWPLWENSGTTALELTNARNGSYTGGTLSVSGIGDGKNGHYLDGASGHFVDVYSTALNTAWVGTEGSLLIWCKVNSSSIWTDSTTRKIATFSVDGYNYLLLTRTTTNNNLLYRYVAGLVGGYTIDDVTKTDGGSTDWMCLGLTWSDTGDAMKAYYNGVQEGSTQTGLNTWSGNLDSDVCILGSDTAASPTQDWHGYLAHCAVWDAPLTATQMADLAKV